MSYISFVGLLTQARVIWREGRAQQVSAELFAAFIGVFLTGMVFAQHNHLWLMLAANTVRLPLAVIIFCGVCRFGLVGVRAFTWLWIGIFLSVIGYTYRDQSEFCSLSMGCIALGLGLLQIGKIIRARSAGAVTLAFGLSQQLSAVFWGLYLSQASVAIQFFSAINVVVSTGLTISIWKYRVDRSTDFARNTPSRSSPRAAVQTVLEVIALVIFLK
jgi:hypothetical protein